VLPALFLPVFSLATSNVVISMRYRIFLPACPALQEELYSAAALFGFYSKFSFRLGVLKFVSVSVTLRWGSCWCCPDFGVFVFG
jgi:hypothetical protein